MEGVHNWKQFLVHMTIVVLGIMIAIGLEQTVEKIHHVHQRHEFEAQLRQEGLANQKIVESDVRWLDAQVAWLLSAKQFVDSYRLSHGKLSGSLPRAPQDDTRTKGSVGDADPQTAVWTMGKESGLVALLPQEQAESYGTMYNMAQLEIEQDHASLQAQSEELALIAGRSDVMVDRNLAGLSDQQLEALSLAFGRAYMSWDMQRRYLVMFYGEDQAVLNGGTSRQAFDKGIADAFRKFPDKYAPF
jgi:hypothetical protein